MKQQHTPFSVRLKRLGVTSFAGLLVLLIALSVWVGGTQRGAQFASSALTRMSAGAVQIEGVHGRLAGSVVIDRLLITSGQEKITLMNLRLDWEPLALLRNQLHVTSLRAERMILSHKIQQRVEPARLPENIALPLALQIDKVQIDASEIGWGPVSIAQLGAVAFSLDFDRSRYRLQLTQLAAHSVDDSQAGANTIGGNFNGDATLAVTKPYALQADFLSGGQVVLQDQTVGINGRIALHGSLAELTTTVDLMLDKAQLQGHAVLRPFSDQALVNANLAAHEFDFSALRPALPHTELDIHLFADASGTGRLSLTNKAAGLYSDGKLPLSTLQAAFRQQAGQLHIEQMAAKLGTLKQQAGVVDGSGQYANGALNFSLLLKAVDLHLLDQRLQSTRLGGQVGITHAAGKQQFTVQLTQPLSQSRRKSMALAAHASLADDRLAIDRAELMLGTGSMKAAGHIDLAGQNTFSAEGRMSHFRLQDMGRFEQLPGLDINGKFSLRGARKPQLVADLAFEIIDSRLAGYSVHGEGKAQLRADRLLVPKLVLAAGDNRLQLHGELSEGNAQLLFALDAPNLAQLGPGFGGAVQAHGSAHGSFKEPHIDIVWQADKLRMPSRLQLENTQGKAALSVDRNQPFFIKTLVLDGSAHGLRTAAQELTAATAHLQFSPQANAPLAMSFQADGLTAPQLRADHFSMLVQGTTARHAIDASMVDADQKWTLKAEGGLKDLQRTANWQGRINRLDAGGQVVGHLAAPAPLSVSRQRVQLDQFLFDANTASIAIEQFIHDQNSIATRGRFERLQLASLLQFAATQAALTTDLQLAGEWNITLANTVSGSIKVRRQSGDIVMQSGANVPLGLRNMDASALVTNGRLTLRLGADGGQLGHIELNANARMASGIKRLSLLPDAALAGTAKLDIPSLTWAGPLISPSLITDGRLQSAISVSGTFADPRLAGQIAGTGLRLFFMEQGVDLRQGTLDGTFENNALIVKQLDFQSADGRLMIAGPINWRDGKTAAHLALKAEHFALLNRVDRKLVVSGQSQIDTNDNKTKISGAVDVDSGFFDLGRDETPRLSDDVVIVGRTQKSTTRMMADADIKIALGDGVTLKGRGLDALLKGQIHVVSGTKEALRGQGSLEIAKGTYTAYGRKLAIEKGALRFNGPIDNPALDILAMQRARGQEVEAGVAVTGTVLAPRITLVSEPSVPDAEKLSWLVLGHGLDNAANADLSALQAAAGALLTDRAAGGVQSQLAAAFGLDEISIKTNQNQNNVQQRIVTLGKQLSSKLYVGYEQGFETATSVLHLRYTLSKRLSLEGEAGARSALSVFYNILFD